MLDTAWKIIIIRLNVSLSSSLDADSESTAESATEGDNLSSDKSSETKKKKKKKTKGLLARLKRQNSKSRPSSAEFEDPEADFKGNIQASVIVFFFFH